MSPLDTGTGLGGQLTTGRRDRPSLVTLRPHQKRGIEMLREEVAAGNRCVICAMPTGAGKTVLAAALMARALQRGRRSVFVVPALSLDDQTVERLVENGFELSDIGVIQGDHPLTRPHAAVQVATAQTLGRRKLLPLSNLVIVDECHVQHAVIARWMAEASHITFVGLSATPWSPGLGKVWQALVRPTSLADLTRDGYLSPARFFAPSRPDLAGVQTVRGDYDEAQLADRMSRPTIVADVVSTWLARAENRPTLVFAVNRAHAALLSDQFAEVGVSTAYVDAFTDREERERVGRAFADGSIRVVVNVGVLTTGVDWDVRCIVLARPTKSASLFVQIVGRSLRTAPGKADSLILDHSDTTLRLGLPTDIEQQFTELDIGARRTGNGRDAVERTAPLPRDCSECSALVPAGVRECPECGHVVRRPAKVDNVDGELSEFRCQVGTPKTPSVRDAIRALGKGRVMAELRGLQMERGRSNGWTSNSFREVFDVWPRGLDHVQPENPSPPLRAWCRSRDIAFVKSRKATEASDAV